MNKGLVIGIIVIAILLIGGWFLYNNWQSSPTSEYNSSPGSNPTQPQTQTQGTVYFSVADAAVNMGTISSVDMTVDKVYLHSQGQGWITVSQTPETFKLLDLKSSGKAGLLAKASVPADSYDQVWFHVATLTVTESGKVKEAKMPSNDVKFNGLVKVVANADSTAKFDVMADQSIHKTGKGEFIFTPVVQFESRSNATVNVDSSNAVVASDGTVDANLKVGMDVNGEVKNNFSLAPEVNLNINSSGLINVK